MRAWLAAGLIATGCGFSAPDLAIDALDSDGPPSEGDARRCPDGYQPIVGLAKTSRYRFESTEKSWVDAMLDCQDDGALNMLPVHLIVLDNLEERAAMILGLTGGPPINDQWIGLTDLAAENTFSYVTAQGTVFDAMPTGNMPDEDCVRIKMDGVAEARRCGDTDRFVCECDPLAADPTRYPNPPNGM